MDEHARPALWDLIHRARLQKIDNDYLDPEVRYDGTGFGLLHTVPQPPSRGRTGEKTGGTIPLSEVPNSGDNGRGGEGNYSGNAENCTATCDKTRSRVGRVYPTIKMTGTESGRFSYADPPVHSWPDEIRHLVRPREGYLWLGTDYQQVEARVFAILTNDTKDLEVFRRFDENPEDREWDIHYRTACDLFGYGISELLSKPGKQVKGIRDYSKNFRYGVLLYGGSPTITKAKVGCPCPRCADKSPPTVEVTPTERKRHADRWFTQHPNVAQWRERISYEVMRTHALKGPMGQKWYFLSPWSTAVQREAWNRIIQGTAATIIHRAMRGLHRLGCPMCLQHHDALCAETYDGPQGCLPRPVEDDSVVVWRNWRNEVFDPTSGTRYWANQMREIMEQPVPELDNRRFPVEITCGPSWGEMRPWNSTIRSK
jgi:hypothetical protein